jgi:hypothetical protein
MLYFFCSSLLENMDDIYEPVSVDKIILILQLFGEQEYLGTRQMKNMMKLQLFFLTH